MTAQILNYKNFVVPCAVKGCKTYVTRLGNTTYKNYAGQYVLRPNLPRHCLALVGRTTKTVAGYGIFTSSGLCFLSQSLSAAFMRVCQPLPVALNASTTSGEYRIFTDTFGQSVTGRPLRRKVFNWLYGKSLIFSSSSSIVSGSDFAALRIFASSSSEGSIVPGLNLSFDMAFNLPSVCLSQADNSAFVIVTVSKYNAVNTVIQIAESYKSVFPVIAPGIHPDNRRFPFEELSLSQRNTVLTLVDGVLVWIKGDFHVFIVATKNNFANCLHWLAVMSYAYPALHKTGAGCGNSKLLEAIPDAESVFFVVCYMCHSMAWYAKQQGSYNRRSPAILSYHATNNGAVCSPYDGLLSGIRSRNSTSRRQRMVTLAGQPQGWPVSSNAGISTPVDVTAPVERGNSSSDSVNVRGCRLMATTPAQNMLFVWWFHSGQNPTYLTTTTTTTTTTTATSEREACLQLPAVRLVFIARIRMEVQHYA